MRRRDRESIKPPPQQSPKARRCRQGTPRCAAAESPCRQQRREQRGGRARESGNAGAGRLAAGSHGNSGPSRQRSLFWRPNYPSHRFIGVCVCARVCVCVCVERGRERESVCVSVCYPKAPGPRSPRGRQINLAAPPVRPNLLPSGTELLGRAVTIGPVTDPGLPGERANRPPPRLGKSTQLLTQDP